MLALRGFTPEMAYGGACRSVWWDCSSSLQRRQGGLVPGCLSPPSHTHSLCQRKGLALGIRAHMLVSPAMGSLLPQVQAPGSSEDLEGALLMLLASPTDASWPRGSVPALLPVLLLTGMKAEILLCLLL